MMIASWWLNQPIWKILVKLGIISPNRGEHKNIWNHHLADDDWDSNAEFISSMVES